MAREGIGKSPVTDFLFSYAAAEDSVIPPASKANGGEEAMKLIEQTIAGSLHSDVYVAIEKSAFLCVCVFAYVRMCASVLCMR